MAMKRYLCAMVLVTAGVIAAGRLQAADAAIAAPLRAQYETTSSLMLGMVEGIPEDKYDFKPTPEVRSFREQMQHVIAENTNYLNLMNQQPTGDQARFAAIKTKAQIVAALKESIENIKKSLATMTDETGAQVIAIPPDAPAGIRGSTRPRWSVIMAVLLDNMDHYGNLVVYARLNGITPPRTAARQQPAPQK
ncbi:MAG: DinB family protein [Acidobacteria bacterium]|nr:DinB family protein [Acidobacteriota bacterium]